MAPTSDGGGTKDESAKHVLDEFGQKVYEEIVGKKADAKTYKDELRGKLSLAPIWNESAGTDDPCKLESEYTELISGSLASGGAARGHPCGNVSGNDGTGNDDLKRFSKERVSKYDEKKIRGSNDGACPPYRRLSLCNKNLENIKTNIIDNKHDLLVDVCMAAKYEGESIKAHYPKYDAEYSSGSGSDFPMCTMLARSFADIGDIVRGKDLYSGNKKKEKLEQNLQKIFKEIYDKLNGAKDHYQKDGDKFFQLREDWWTANRHTVWKALTCKAEGAYFRPTCSDGNSQSQATKQCRCNDKPNAGKPKAGNGDVNIVPTYFDYVPQYIRWFEEWAEDFCRKKKKKVQNLQKQCRGTDASKEPRYCSRNGFDCEKTISRIGKVRMGKGCTDCFFACHRYENWIDNQRKQFLKQKNIYENEILGNSSRRRGAGGATTTNYEEYEKKFYLKLQSNGYGDVNDFLGLLSKEKACEQITTQEEGRINFAEKHDDNNNDKEKGTFYRSKYCQPCPDCGVKPLGGGKFQDKETKRKKCEGEKLYEPKPNKEGTTITILKSGENHDDIETKLKAFCKTQNGGGVVLSGGRDNEKKSDKDSLYEEWKCYEGKDVKKVKNGEEEDDEEDVQEVKDAGGLCILKNDKNKKEEKTVNEPEQFQKTFHDLFYYWVAHMLKDSIYWETQKLDKCLQNGNKKCGKKICNSDCDCFKRWVDQKKEQEWMKIRNHFYTQEIKGFQGELFKLSHDDLLKQVLKEEFYKEKSEDASAQDNQNSLDAEEAKELKQLSKIIESEENQEAGAGANGKKNIMDKLIDYEEKEAQKCLEKRKQTCPPPEESPDRSQTPPASRSDSPRVDQKEEEEEEEEEDDEDEDEVEDTAEGETQAETEQVEDQVNGEGEQPVEDHSDQVEEGTTQDNAEKPCEIVDKLFNNPDNFKEVACQQKYAKNNSRLGWKCIASDTKSVATVKSDASGSICVPPRRRRLYVGHLQKWAEKYNKVAPQVGGGNTKAGESSQSSSGSETPSQPDPKVELRDAFVESAAIETFFLWDRYKKIKEKEKQEEQQRQQENGGRLATLNGDTLSVEQTPENQLKSGIIPNDFLRLMFYTLADYKDILFSGSKDDNTKSSTYNDIISGDKEIAQREKTIKGAISTYFSNSGTTPTPVTQPSGQKTTPKDWWKENAKHIWEGMICALTYKESENGDKTIEKDEQVYEKIFGKDNNDKPGTTGTNTGTTGTPTGTYNDRYKYETVKLDDQSETEAISNDNPTLEEFSKRPTYFRWLHEWGESFCRERKKRLKDIIYECRNIDKAGHHYCSGDGHDCTDKNLRHKNMSADLFCRDCHKQCRKYRKWIDIKFEEFQNQKSIYQAEHGKLKANHNGDNNCCKEIHNRSTAAKFLEALKHCKNNEGDEEKEEDKKNNKIDFGKPLETFRHSKYCETCPFNRVTCNSGRKSGTNGCNVNGNGETWESVFNGIPENGGKTTTITVEMIDRRGPFIKEYLNNSQKSEKSNDLFNASRLFKGLRVQNWKCKFNDQKMNVCHLINFNKDIDLNKYTTFKVFLLYWLEDFLYGYYISKKRKIVEKCTQKGEKACSGDGNSKNDCACVKIWIEQKEKEWDQIKNYYDANFKTDSEHIYSRINSFFEQQLFDSGIKKDKQKVTELRDLERSLGCECAENSKKIKDADKKDIVECIHKYLEKKIGECTSQPSGENEAQCENSSPFEDDDEEDLLLVEDDKIIKQPGFCPPPEEKTEIEGTDDKCEEASSPVVPEQPAKEDGDPAAQPEDDTEKKAPVKPTPTKPQRPRRPRRTLELLDNPPFKTALMSSTIMWSIGIGFAAKKEKRNIKKNLNLFQILQIPKGDYDIPTLKSSNRYIPYASDRYKGKTYIYMEGDSSGDEKYAFMSDTTDVTSSESEYEELDINDIYVPGSPKYKTLIEVVLEPSKRDTQNDIHNDIPSDIPNTPSDTPPPITDDEWNQLKKDFISNMLQNTQNTEPNILHDNVDNNTHPTMSRHKMDQKPFIMSIHDRNLYIGEEYSYDMSTNSGQNNVYSGIDPTSANHDSYSDKNDPISDNHHPYSGIDLINDVLNGDYDIYDEILKRKENELFGTNHTKKNTSTNSVAKNTNSDPILNQINLFHKWLDRHRYMCAKLKNKEDILNKLKEEWNKENNNNSGKTYNSDNKPSHNHVLNTDVSIQIDMDNPKTKNEFKNMDTTPNKSTMNTMLDDLEKYNEPYYYDFYKDDIYYDVNDDDKASVDHNKMDNNNSDVPTKVQIEMNVINNQELLQNEYPISHM
ncbi:hypothetical protein PFNF54_01758 [Plasmodium falciparum NF54]|uniref:Erythrocyte membrane protein 1 n=1 Tax=Plasmodium falciparum (isolate NF54) TaxID=5843 RepID=W7JX00_PLAFO|nr:hypothetical protein PFNF54_01758 [Plasmodium falciparum NF54]